MIDYSWPQSLVVEIVLVFLFASATWRSTNRDQIFGQSDGVMGFI